MKEAAFCIFVVMVILSLGTLACMALYGVYWLYAHGDWVAATFLLALGVFGVGALGAGMTE